MKSGHTTRVRIDSLQWPVTVLGFGARIGIWFQGCSIGCPGCCARHTWNADEGTSVAVDDVLDWVGNLPLGDVDGVTITGGEPFEQPEALGELVARLRREVRFDRRVDVLCYSGYPWDRISRRHADVLAMLDTVITGPYVEKLPPKWLLGSSNQAIQTLSELARERYPDDPSRTNGLQIVPSDCGVRIVGIPNRGDLERMEGELVEHGVTFGETSWRRA